MPAGFPAQGIEPERQDKYIDIFLLILCRFSILFTTTYFHGTSLVTLILLIAPLLVEIKLVTSLFSIR